MEFFNTAKVVRLKSHIGKYLVADRDEESVWQSYNGSSRKAVWMVEFVEKNPHMIRLKSCYDKYLTASDEPFLLRMTGEKVMQTIPASATTPLMKQDTNCVEWEPIREGDLVRLRTRGAKFLRANGATPPWRNSVTIDLPYRTATQDWVLWEVDVVDTAMIMESAEYLSSSSCSSPLMPDNSVFSRTHSISITSESCVSPSAIVAYEKRGLSLPTDISQWQSGMEVFEKAKNVRLRSHLGKYLVADDDEETVIQNRNGSSHKALWTVELVEGRSHVIRLKSCHGLYLAAIDEPFLLGMTGKKVLQTLPCKKIETSNIEWEPLVEGFHIKLRTSEGRFLRANGATIPWRNSITHDVPHRSATKNWVLWGVDVVEVAISDTESEASSLSPSSSFNSLPDDFTCSPDVVLPSVHPERSPNATPELVSLLTDKNHSGEIFHADEFYI